MFLVLHGLGEKPRYVGSFELLDELTAEAEKLGALRAQFSATSVIPRGVAIEIGFALVAKPRGESMRVEGGSAVLLRIWLPEAR